MPQIQSFSAYVVVDGKELEEHRIEYSKKDKMAACWIASEAGKVRTTFVLRYMKYPGVTKCVDLQAFTIKWKDTTRIRLGATSGRVTLDGIKSGQRTIRPGRLGDHNTAERSYITTGPKSVRPYSFSNLQLTGSYAHSCFLCDY